MIRLGLVFVISFAACSKEKPSTNAPGKDAVGSTGKPVPGKVVVATKLAAAPAWWDPAGVSAGFEVSVRVEPEEAGGALGCWVGDAGKQSDELPPCPEPKLIVVWAKDGNYSQLELTAEQFPEIVPVFADNDQWQALLPQRESIDSRLMRVSVVGAMGEDYQTQAEAGVIFFVGEGGPSILWQGSLGEANYAMGICSDGINYDVVVVDDVVKLVGAPFHDYQPSDNPEEDPVSKEDCKAKYEPREIVVGPL